ncbi:MAG: 3-oxoacyl-ACP reductase FabG [Chloroflexi bacterium]|nr:3-oxoacyl-ACP reductase FabG [Chloroflexota bacterium]
MRLQDKVCLITGGAAGIGRATAELFAQHGAIVVVADVRQTSTEGLGEYASAYAVNVTDRQAVQAWVDEVAAKYGRIDILINNAGITRDGQLVKMKDGQLTGQMSEEAFDLVVDVNLKGVFNCTQAAVPHMINSGGGAILNASSVVGLDGNFGQTNYVATKAGVVGMTKVWARELGRYNIRVNAIAPGFIATDMTAAMPEKVFQGMVGHTPLGRAGQPQDIAQAYIFLTSDEANFISGVTLRVDGGLVIGT